LAVAGSRFTALSPPPPSPPQSKGHKAEPSPAARPMSASKASPLRSPVPPAYVLDGDGDDGDTDGAPAVAPSKASPLRVTSALPPRERERDRERDRDRERESKEFKSKAGLSAALKIAEAQQALRASAAVLGAQGPRTAAGTRQYVGDFIANRSEMAAVARSRAVFNPAAAPVPADRLEAKRGPAPPPSSSSSSSSGPRLVVDEAFWRAMGKVKVPTHTTHCYQCHLLDHNHPTHSPHHTTPVHVCAPAAARGRHDPRRARLQADGPRVLPVFVPQATRRPGRRATGGLRQPPVAGVRPAGRRLV
jgi:hypothetical protein